MHRPFLFSGSGWCNPIAAQCLFPKNQLSLAMRVLLYLCFAILPTNFLLSQSSGSYQQALEKINAFQFEQALHLLADCYSIDANDLDCLLKIGYCHLQIGRYEDAKLFFNQSLKIDSSNATALSSLGMIYEREANYRKAMSYYLQLIGLDSLNSYYQKRAGYMAVRMDNSIVGIGFFLKAHELQTNDLETIDQLSELYIAMNELDFAEQMIEKGLVLAPNNIQLLRNKARVHTKRQEYEEVVSALEKTMAQGDTTEYYQLMAGVAYLQIDSVEQALFHLQRVLDRGEETEHVHHYLGRAYQAQGEIDTAQHHYEKAIQLGISSKMGLFHADLAKLFDEKNQLKSALEHYTLAYQYSQSPEHLFQLARASDIYYKDKKVALRYYEQYLQTSHGKYRSFTEGRVLELKEYLHLRGG